MELQYPALKARVLRLAAAIEKERLIERKRAIKQILQLLDSVELQPEDLRQHLKEHVTSVKNPVMRGAEKQTAFRIKHPPQFIDPATGQSWSGRGRRPKWLTGDIERFRVVGF